MMTHFKSEGLSADHIRSLFNPDDAQDVKLAFDMLKDVWNMPRLLHELPSSKSPGFLQTREALWVLGKLLFHMVFPYLCVDLSLSEQIEHLSAAAHLALPLFRLARKDFIPTNLYIDLMLTIKNVLFCVAKAKVDDPNGEFWIILLGTDRLEGLFGILRTMVGNDANLDIYQLVCRLAGTTEVSNILAKYPHWDRSPRRLRLPSLSRESKEIPDSADHIKPASWKGNVKVKDVSLQTSWNRGRHLIEQECEAIRAILQELDVSDNVNILSPFGTILFDTPLADDDIDESLEYLAPAFTSTVDEEITESDANMRVEVEDALDDIATMSEHARNFDKEVTFRGSMTSKARALARFSKDRKHNGPGSTDRLRRVQDVGRHPKASTVDNDPSALPAEDTEVLFALDTVCSLVYVETRFWLSIGEVTGIKVNGRSAPYVDLDMLGDDTVMVSYQLLGLRSATTDDDPDRKHDWRTHPIQEHSFTVPGRLIQPINPTTSKTHTGLPFYLLESAVLVALTASLFQSLAVPDLKRVPKLLPSKEYPYREASGMVCFVCESDQDLHVLGSSDCPRCSPCVSLDLSQGQRVLEHVGAHHLLDPGVDRSMELCGLCLRPAPLCQFFLTKGKGSKGKPKINDKFSKGCLMPVKFSYNVASQSSSASPCSNVPIQCPICPTTDPAVWRYSLKPHFNTKHKTLVLSGKYDHLWKLSNFEMTEMKKIWAKRATVATKRTRKSKIPPLVVSEDHRAQIPTRYCAIDCVRKAAYFLYSSGNRSEISDPESDAEVGEELASESELSGEVGDDNAGEEDEALTANSIDEVLSGRENDPPINAVASTAPVVDVSEYSEAMCVILAKPITYAVSFYLIQ
jgi:hypothetical protein